MRAGRYIKQPNGYAAFIPKPLPPSEPPLRLDSQLSLLLFRAGRALGQLNGSITTLPDPDLFVFMYVRKEAVLSSMWSPFRQHKLPGKSSSYVKNIVQ